MTGGTTEGQLSMEIPAAAIAYLAGLETPMDFSGQVVDGPQLVAQLGLLPPP